jgi:hypothetical protein
MSIRKEIIRAMADAERRMDAGELPFVMAPGPTGIFERFPLEQDRMDDYGLKQGQRINTIIRDAILDESDKILKDRLNAMLKSIADVEETLQEGMMEDDFDFRNMMGEDGEDNPTKH